METVSLITSLALIWKVVDLVKYAKDGDKNGVITQLMAWLTGVGLAFLLGAADMAANWDIGGVILSDINAASKILLGLVWGSGASAIVDFKKARDNTDSAAVPPLLHDRPDNIPAH